MSLRIKIIVTAVLLQGCVSTDTSAPIAESEPPIVSEPIIRTAGNSAVNRLLEDAHQALRADQLMTPVNDNAYDRYQAVMQLSPNNKEAAKGLGQIAARYLELAWSARSDANKSRMFLGRADTLSKYLPGYAQKRQRLIARLDSFRSPVTPVKAQQKAVLDWEIEEWPLNGRLLGQKSVEVKDQLLAAGRRIKAQKESVLIYVRNDSEGRWVYGQLKAAAQGYRVRGDIRIAKTPRLVFEAPL